MTEGKWGPGHPSKWQLVDSGELHSGENLRIFRGEYPHTREENSLYAHTPDGTIVNFNGHRVRTKVVIEEVNYLITTTQGGQNIQKVCLADISFNGKFCYRVHGSDQAFFVLHKVQSVLPVLLRHPIPLWLPAWGGLVGTKVYHYDQAAVVTAYNPEEGMVTLEAIKGWLKTPSWRSREGHEEQDVVLKDNFLSPFLHWSKKS